jgi:hypothetical protein
MGGLITSDSVIESESIHINLIININMSTCTIQDVQIISKEQENHEKNKRT